jgi:hypothetical protein
MTGPKTGLASLELKDAVRLRWALHDIKSQRTEIVPVSPDDLRILIDMGVEMQGDVHHPRDRRQAGQTLRGGPRAVRNESTCRGLNPRPFVELGCDLGTPVRSARPVAEFTAGTHAPGRGHLHKETPRIRAGQPGMPAGDTDVDRCRLRPRTNAVREGGIERAFYRMAQPISHPKTSNTTRRKLRWDR